MKTCLHFLLEHSKAYFVESTFETFPGFTSIIKLVPEFDVYNCTFIGYVCAVFPHPPEVFPVGLFGNIVFGVDLSLQGAKASPLRDVFLAEHSRNLKDRSMIKLD